jgi:hypothetical protein
LPAIDEAIDVQQIEVIDCSDDIHFAEALAIVDFRGDPDEASAIEYVALEAAFQNTYNSLNALNPDSCDMSFREVVWVSLIDTDAGQTTNLRKLQVGGVSASCLVFNSLYSYHSPSCFELYFGAVVAHPTRSFSKTMRAVAACLYLFLIYISSKAFSKISLFLKACWLLRVDFCKPVFLMMAHVLWLLKISALQQKKSLQ